MIEFEIQIISNRFPFPANETIKAKNNAITIWGNAGIEVKPGSPDSNYRSGVDPTILVAVVGAAASVLTAFVTGLMAMIKKGDKEHLAQKVVLQSKNGHRLEIPSNTSTDKIQEYVEVLKQMDSEKIWVNFE